MLRNPSSNKVDMTEINNMVVNAVDDQFLLIRVEELDRRYTPNFRWPLVSNTEFGDQTPNSRGYMSFIECSKLGVFPISYLDEYDIFMTLADDVPRASAERAITLVETNEMISPKPRVDVYASYICAELMLNQDPPGSGIPVYPTIGVTVVLKRKKKTS